MQRLIKYLTTLVAIVAIQSILASFAIGQLSVGGRPKSYDLSGLKPNVVTTELAGLNVDSILAVDEIERAAGKLYRLGIAVQRNLNLSNSGTWDTLGTEGYLWRLKIEAEAATFISINYDEFTIPEGATYHVYNPNDITRYLGAFTNKNNLNGGIWATSPLVGSEVILEYFEPLNAKFTGTIEISSIVHGYRGKGRLDKIGYGDSYACQINVSCPEGDAWEDQIHSVVMISTDSNTRACTGTLMNNVRQDSIPYILTGYHCLDDIALLGNWIFRFNYESPLIDASACDSVFDDDSLLTLSIVGASFKCSTGIFEKSDNMLLLLDSAVPDSFNAYYAGWSSDSGAPSSTATIHHPGGDIKKISIDSDSAVFCSGSFYNHWDATYYPDSTGLVEGVTSGAPLFDHNKRVVGTHFDAFPNTGDLCNATSQEGRFANFYTSWDTESDSTQQLKYWLDPDTTDTLFIDGFDPNASCCIDDRGDANGDGDDATILDLTYLVDFLFRGGLLVECTQEGNMNGDSNENIDILDLTYLIDAIFRGGPQPGACP